MIWCVARDGGWGKVGGWNTRSKHWYVSKVLASGQNQLMQRLGFRWMENSTGRHCWWQIDGAENTGAFQAAVEALTGVAILANKGH